MTKQERAAYRILASLYPDRKPSEIRKIIDKAMDQEERSDDMELWAILVNEKLKEEPEKPEVTKKIIEEHHYHHYDRPWYTYGTTITSTTANLCSNDAVTTDSVTCCANSADYCLEGVTIGVSCCD